METTLPLNTGATMPMVGLGTWKSKPGEVKAAVEAAIDAGYRHIDCAFVYGNENEVGEAVQCKIKQGIVKREELFITTKLWLTYFSPERVRECLDISLSRLKLGYVDLYLIHFPSGLQFTKQEEMFPMENGKGLIHEIDYVDVWKELEKLKQAGLAKTIGVSNFNEYQIKRLLKEGSIKPAVNQFECHPYLDQEELLKVCQSNGIVVTGYSPFGSPDRPWAKPDDPSLFEEPQIKKIAEKHGKTVAQVLLRYQLQRGIVVIPKSVTPSRIVSNLEVFDFDLSEEERNVIKKQDRNWRVCTLPLCKEHKYYPFKENYSE